MMWFEDRTPHAHMWQFLNGSFRINRSFVCAKIINIGPGTLLWLTHPYRFASDNPCNLSLRIMHIPCNNSSFWTNYNTCWLQANLSTMGTIVALCGSVT